MSKRCKTINFKGFNVIKMVSISGKKDFPQDLAQQSSLLHEDIYQLDPVFFKRYQ